MYNVYGLWKMYAGWLLLISDESSLTIIKNIKNNIKMINFIKLSHITINNIHVFFIYTSG